MSENKPTASTELQKQQHLKKPRPSWVSHLPQWHLHPEIDRLNSVVLCSHFSSLPPWCTKEWWFCLPRYIHDRSYCWRVLRVSDHQQPLDWSLYSSCNLQFYRIVPTPDDMLGSTFKGVCNRNECMPRPLIHMFAFTFFRAVTIGSLLLTASGLTWNITLDGLKYLSVVVKVGMILYLVSWFVMCMFFGILFLYQSSIENGKSLALVAVAISAPFIPVRIIYAMLLFFLANSTFNMIDGSNTVQLVMSVFHKLIVLFVCLPVGFTLTVWEQHWKSVPGLEVA
ncbi:hypothetical protein N7499_004023 [Penicillium canescens]|uniref:DUF7702 domain-containing protein n=1 Tax=Penicillium canescens TaxID=5083 RepID=A0AAD6ND72_PENCN|nr:uncharacterized protein N7446_007535 [Penicillium canescens]KAJ5991608.1 hypothetical protein N7522_011815 [Penicillium canescens]KAJ6049138.1 hypothetical protein N7444_005854 [Penicillium canescens]KAJ6052890.1 hypothetical protein N7460_003424 [Penicillium canescens]KAJ6063415.1 hypothetical protein N7446_007535 [Penicillium canescens]KAJ6089176.1 hypothetical protein N7499_004023 [Penicillium canescens]